MRFSREELIDIIKDEMVNTLKDKSSDLILGEDGGQEVTDYTHRGGVKQHQNIDLGTVLNIKYTG